MVNLVDWYGYNINICGLPFVISHFQYQYTTIYFEYMEKSNTKMHNEQGIELSSLKMIKNPLIISQNHHRRNKHKIKQIKHSIIL